MRKIKNCVNECDKLDNIEFPEFTIISGSSNVLFSAPHTYIHMRKNESKVKDFGTLTIIKMLKRFTKAHVIYTNKPVDYDPNYDKNNKYKKCLNKYIKEKNIEYLIDIHGSQKTENFDIEIGTNRLKNINEDENLLNEIKKIMKKNNINNISVDENYKSARNTICNQANSRLKIISIQLEVGKNFRVIKNNNKNYKNLINTLIDIALFLERRDKMIEIDYQTKYDEVLDIKPSYGYNRELKPVNFDEVGLEIEVAVNYDRNSYSFIKKLLTKIKKLIGENGYFVKDGTITAEYSFEIVLDPMNVEEISKIYENLMNIIEFSNGLIEISKEKNCGIHLNFNKNDITDINESHKKLTTYICENPKYFEENMYKQFKFIWNFDEYEEYQKTVSSKYVWANYLKKKVVEIRNIKVGMNTKDMATIISEILICLYGDKLDGTIDDKLYNNLEKLYNKSFNKRDDIMKQLKESGVVVLTLKDNDIKMVTISEDIIKKIK